MKAPAWKRPVYPLPLYRPVGILTNRKWVLALERTHRHWLMAESRWVSQKPERWFCWADLPPNYLLDRPRPTLPPPPADLHRIRTLALELHFAPETPTLPVDSPVLQPGNDRTVLLLGNLEPAAQLTHLRHVRLDEPFLWWAYLPENKYADRYLKLAREAEQQAYRDEQEAKAARRAASKGVT